jgi:hypothetical protein
MNFPNIPTGFQRVSNRSPNFHSNPHPLGVGNWKKWKKCPERAVPPPDELVRAVALVHDSLGAQAVEP